MLAVTASAQSRGGVDALDEVLNELPPCAYRWIPTPVCRKRCPTIRQAKKQRRSSPWRSVAPPPPPKVCFSLERAGSTRGRHCQTGKADEFAEIIVTGDRTLVTLRE